MFWRNNENLVEAWVVVERKYYDMHLSEKNGVKTLPTEEGRVQDILHYLEEAVNLAKSFEDPILIKAGFSHLDCINGLSDSLRGDNCSDFIFEVLQTLKLSEV